MEELIDFAWMSPPDGGEPQKVRTADIGERMWKGWRQCAPPSSEDQEK